MTKNSSELREIQLLRSQKAALEQLLDVYEKSVLENTEKLYQEIAEREKADEALRSLNLRYEAVLASVPDIIMEVDINKVYTWANHAGYDFFGPDVIGKEASFYFEGQQETYDIVQPNF
jgi:PAS domain-containing protein